MKTRILSWLRSTGIIFRFLTSVVLVLAALGALVLGGIIRLSEPAVTAMLILLSIWCFSLAGFINFRRRVSPRTQRGIALALLVFAVCYYFAWTNLWRLQTYQEHRNWTAYGSKHFIFHYAPNYPRAAGIATFANVHDKVFEEICGYLRVSFKSKIDFYLYEKLDEGFAVPDWNVIFADDDQSIGHEITHIIAYHISGNRQKIRLLDEGIATWLNHSTVTKDHHAAARDYIRTNGMPSLNELSSTRTFRHHQPPPYYPAASFVGYLIERYGLDYFRRLWTASAEYSELYSGAEELHLAKYLTFIPRERAYFESMVSHVYGRTLNTLDTEWRAWLESYDTH